MKENNDKIQIKYYEEIYNDNFKEKVINYLTDYLNGKKDINNPYEDPDEYYRKEGSRFYEDFTEFLNTITPKRKFTYRQEYPDCIVDNGTKLILRTDQFGFSFEGSAAYDSKHPYGHYLQMIKEDKKNLNEELEFIADCINTTRTIGGVFIWPIVKQGKYFSLYNRNRGIDSYIEDTVDLTLYEIKKFYEKLNHKDYRFEKKEDKKQKEKVDFGKIISDMTRDGFLLLSDEDAPEICRWLRQFETFEEYVDRFCFKPFVNEKNKKYEVIDITKFDVEKNDEYCVCKSDAILNENIVKEYREDNKKKRIRDIKNPEKIKKILNNVRWLTIKRSVEIEKIINEDRKVGYCDKK